MKGRFQMRARNLASLASIVVLTIAGLMLLTSASATGQTPAAPKAAAAKAFTPPKTPWGDPDLQGTFTSDDYINTPLQRPANLGDRLYLTNEEIAAREATIKSTAQTDLQEFAGANARVGTGPPSHWGERAKHPPKQTSLIVDPPDGRMPPLTAEARTRKAGIGAGNNDPRPDSWEDFTYYIRCITRGVTGSIFPVIYGNGTQIVQGPGYVTILQEMVHEARVIPLNVGTHVSGNIRTYMGDSIGHFEGNTLVVDTTNFLAGKTGTGPNGGGTPTSDALHLVERFTRVDADTVNYEVTIDDPKTYTKPWKVAFPIYQEPGYQLFEYACHEGNYAMKNSLSGARAQDKADEAAGKK